MGLFDLRLLFSHLHILRSLLRRLHCRAFDGASVSSAGARRARRDDSRCLGKNRFGNNLGGFCRDSQKRFETKKKKKMRADRAKIIKIATLTPLKISK